MAPLIDRARATRRPDADEAEPPPLEADEQFLEQPADGFAELFAERSGRLLLVDDGRRCGQTARAPNSLLTRRPAVRRREEPSLKRAEWQAALRPNSRIEWWKERRRIRSHKKTTATSEGVCAALAASSRAMRINRRGSGIISRGLRLRDRFGFA